MLGVYLRLGGWDLRFFPSALSEPTSQLAPGPSLYLRVFAVARQVPYLPALGLRWHHVVLGAVSDQERFGRLNPHQAKARGEQAEEVGIRFAETHLKGEETKRGVK